MPKPTRTARRLLRTNEAAEYIGVSDWTLRRLVQKGDLPYIRYNGGGPWLFDIRDLDAFIEQHKQVATDYPI